MQWSQPKYTRGRVEAAGKILSGRKTPSDALPYDEALNIAANWRSAHAYPLQLIATRLRSRATGIDSTSIVAQRLKRLPSIIAKLKRSKVSQLDMMNDLGGCRAILKSIEGARELATSFVAYPPADYWSLVRNDDYVENPKADGYRGIHLVYELKASASSSPLARNLEGFTKSRIEIQIRSDMQHLWSTAVETIDTLTGQSLKSGQGGSQWERFFALASSWIALKESCKPVPGTHDQGKDRLVEELQSLCSQLRVIELLSALKVVVGRPEPESTVAILILNSGKRVTEILYFPEDATAAETYLRAEKNSRDDSGVQVVMVTSDSISTLKKAYSNYFLDASGFVAVLEEVMKARRQYSPWSLLVRSGREWLKTIATIDQGGDVNDL